MPRRRVWACLTGALLLGLSAPRLCEAERFRVPEGPVDPVDLYRAGIASTVQENWHYRPENFLGWAVERVSVTFQVLPDGTITDIAIRSSSGSAHLERSALEAVARSNPVLPHPPGLHMDALAMGITFHSHFRNR